jgi:hypothetical protein
MSSKFTVVSVSIIILTLSWVFFATDSSYQEAIKARFYYEIANYEQAHALAKTAYEKDSYNKMAYTVLVQSEISLKYDRYIKRGEAYMEQILAISKGDSVNNAQAAKIKLMCEIMIEDFVNLAPSRLTSESLQDEAKNMRDKFLELQKRLF